MIKEKVEKKQKLFLEVVRSIQKNTKMNAFDSAVMATLYFGFSSDDLKKYIPIGLKEELKDIANILPVKENFINNNFR
jgi:hypothetical protein